MNQLAILPTRNSCRRRDQVSSLLPSSTRTRWTSYCHKKNWMAFCNDRCKAATAASSLKHGTTIVMGVFPNLRLSPHGQDSRIEAKIGLELRPVELFAVSSEWSFSKDSGDALRDKLTAVALPEWIVGLTD